MAMFPSILGVMQCQCWLCTNPLLLPMDDTGDSTLAQRNGKANARCEWAFSVWASSFGYNTTLDDVHFGISAIPWDISGAQSQRWYRSSVWAGSGTGGSTSDSFFTKINSFSISENPFFALVHQISQAGLEWISLSEREKVRRDKLWSRQKLNANPRSSSLSPAHRPPATSVRNNTVERPVVFLDKNALHLFFARRFEKMFPFLGFLLYRIVRFLPWVFGRSRVMLFFSAELSLSFHK